MSAENVELVRRMYEAYDRGDLKAVFAAYDPGIEWDASRLDPATGLDLDPVYQGVDGIRHFFRRWLEAWETIKFDYEEFIDAGERVVVVLTQRMRGRTSGVDLEWRSYAQAWTVREGKLTRMEFFPDRAQALEAVGLRADLPSGEPL